MPFDELLGQKDGSIISKTSGEVLNKNQGTFVWVPNKLKLRNFVMLFQENLNKLAEDKEIKGQQYKILLKILAKMGYENEVIIVQKEIANELQIPATRVSEAIKIFLNKGILEKGAKCGVSWGYKLSKKYGWKGKTKNMKK